MERIMTTRTAQQYIDRITDRHDGFALEQLHIAQFWCLAAYFEGQASVISSVAAANSYQRHALDPVAAAESDLLGQALLALSTLVQSAEGDDPLSAVEQMTIAIGQARAVLAQARPAEK